MGIYIRVYSIIVSVRRELVESHYLYQVEKKVAVFETG